MPAPKWTFVLTDVLGNQLGEVTNADNRTLTLPLNRMPTATFSIPTSHRLASYLVDPHWDGLLKCYRNEILRFVGPIVSSDDQYDSSTQVQRLAVNAAGPLWKLGFRLLGTTATGYSKGDATNSFDLGAIVADILSNVNGNTGPNPSLYSTYTGISMGTSTAGITGAAGTYFFKPAADAIAELSTSGFDFEVAPIEPTDIGLTWPKIGTLNVAAVIGTTKSNAVFEFGQGHANLASYGRSLDRSELATCGYIQQPASSDHSGTLSAKSDAAESVRGRYEALIDDGGVQWDSFRTPLVTENVAIRRQARQVVSIQPRVNAAPSPFDDYIVGDLIPVVLVVNSGFTLNANLRVWGITITLDKEGNESVSIQTVSS